MNTLSRIERLERREQKDGEPVKVVVIGVYGQRDPTPAELQAEVDRRRSLGLPWEILPWNGQAFAAWGERVSDTTKTD